jgi:hypothetical protein
MRKLNTAFGKVGSTGSLGLPVDMHIAEKPTTKGNDHGGH